MKLSSLVSVGVVASVSSSIELLVNGVKTAGLPMGSAGRIFLFKLLASQHVKLKVRSKKRIYGHEDPATGEFVPLNASELTKVK